MRNKRNYAITKKNNHYCTYCWIYLYDFQKHVDHFIPVSWWWGNNLENLKVSCKKCNNIKSNFHFDTVFDASKYILQTREQKEKTVFPFSHFIRTWISIDLEKVNQVLRDGIQDIDTNEVYSELEDYELTKKCKNCDNNFLVNEIEWEYCSEYCYRTHTWDIKYEYICQKCGIIFIGPHSSKFCKKCKIKTKHLKLI